MDSKPKARVLVAEDSLAVAHIIRFTLGRAGFSVTVAGDGLAALLAAQHDPFDLVVVDEQMPHMSGRELCQRLRDDPRHANTPFIFVTAKQMEIESDVVRCFGPETAVIGKPFSPATLLQTVEAALGLSPVA